MADITVTSLSKAFAQDRRVLDDISFHIDPGERVALLGDNGAGKTTLFRIITGELEPDSGSVSIAPGRSVGYVAQINTAKSGDTVHDVLKTAYADVIAASDELSRMHADMRPGREFAERYDALERLIASRGGFEWETELARIANGLGIGAEMREKRFDSLSGGEQTRVCLARIIMQNNDILLLDEPTNHLDTASLEWLEDFINHYPGTVVMISHDRYFLDNTAQRIIELRQGKVDFYGGNYSYYVTEREIRFRRQLMMYEREQAKVKQLEFQIARLKAWGSVYDNPALHKKAAAMEKRIERVQQTDKPTEQSRLAMGFSSESFRADSVLEMTNVSKRFENRTLFDIPYAQIRGGGEHIAIVGANGAGKTTLINILLGNLSPDTGSVRTGPQVKCAYLPQKVEFEHPERTLYDTLLYETSCSPQEARDRLGAFRFSGEDQFKTVSQLSGGERTRLKLCIIMHNRANLLVLDEPTNHLDLNSREWIEEAISGFEGTLLFVSHDRYFIRRFADRVWELDGGFTDYKDCDYERYRRLKALKPAEKPAEKKPEKKPAQAQPKKPSNERKMNVLEREIAKKEQELSEFDAKMEAVASDYVALNELEQQKTALQAEIDEMYARWAELAE